MEDTWQTESDQLTQDDTLRVLVERPSFKRTEDQKGHDTFLGARFPKDFGRRVTQLKEESAGHYHIQSDVVRDALYLGLTIIGLRCKSSSEWRQIEQLAQVESTAAALAYEFTRVDNLVESLRRLADTKQVKQARKSAQAYFSILEDEGMLPERRESLKMHLTEQLRNHGLAQLL